MNHSFFGQSGHTAVHIVIYAKLYYTLLYMFALMGVACYQDKTFVNIGKIGLNVLLSDLNCTRLAVYFSNRCIANLSIV